MRSGWPLASLPQASASKRPCTLGTEAPFSPMRAMENAGTTFTSSTLSYTARLTPLSAPTATSRWPGLASAAARAFTRTRVGVCSSTSVTSTPAPRSGLPARPLPTRVISLSPPALMNAGCTASRRALPSFTAVKSRPRSSCSASNMRPFISPSSAANTWRRLASPTLTLPRHS
ncbi:hypothetical protein D3C81_1352620 [compost metagenome]